MPHRLTQKQKMALLDLVKQKVRYVSRACKLMNISRDSFYRFKDLYETGGEAALTVSRCAPNLKNRVLPAIENAVVKLSIDQPTWGQGRLVSELRRQNLSISTFGIRSIWRRHELEDMKKRLKAREAKVTQDGEAGG